MGWVFIYLFFPNKELLAGQGWHGQGVGEERLIPARPLRGWDAQKSLLLPTPLEVNFKP